VPLTDEQKELLRRLREAVAASEARGVPAAVVVAQAVLESGWGRSGLTRKGNAFFGIKADAAWRGAVYSGTTREFEGGAYVTYRGTDQVYASREAALAAGAHPATLFRAYPTFEDSVADHVEFFYRNRRYHGCLRAYQERRDPREFARCIHQAGYATGPRYADSLIRLMEELTPDLLEPERAARPAPPVPAPAPNAAPPIVFVGDRPLPPQAVRMIDGDVWVKARPAFEAAGWTVTWDARTRTARMMPPRAS
jgi:flagellum-specific peptidoglycan hydrolase FlgJ